MSVKAGRQARPPFYPWAVVILLTASNILSLVDRKLPFILIEQIKRDLSITDTQIGAVTGLLFASVYALFMLPVARLADATSRKAVICGAIGFWSLMTALGGMAQNFVQFAATRVGLAIGEAGCAPPAHSLIADHFPPERRTPALGLFMAGAPLGVMLGLGVGGWLADTFDWRTALYLVGGVGIALALTILIVVREPPRAAPTDRTAQPGIWPTARRLLRYATFRRLTAGAVAFAISTTATQAFSAAYLMRLFDYSATSAGLAIGLCAGLSGAVGAIVGGLLSAWLARYDARWSLWMPALALAIAAPFGVMAFQTGSPFLCIALLVIPQVAATLFLAPAVSIVQMLVPRAMWAVGSAVFMLFLQGLGSSLGPFLAGVISDQLAPAYGLASLRISLTLLSCFYAVAALLFYAASRPLTADIAQARAEG